MSNIKNAWRHFKTITHHRHLVMAGCFKVGLYRQGLLHDLSKYTPVEFLVGCKFYQGTRSPNNAEREATGRSLAWLHHKGRNKHHLEYWIDYGLEKGHFLTGMEMPVCYVVEMFIDRVSASKNYEKEKYTDASAYRYYQKGKANLLLHPNTEKLLEELLIMLAEKGEKETFHYVKYEVLKRKK